MSGNDLAAAVTALLTVGILLLNYGASMVQAWDTYTGLMIILFGVALILAAVLVTRLMITRIVRSP